jgi:hypothetical protein
MAARHVAVILSILALALALAACGGSGASLNSTSNLSTSQAFQNWLATVDLSTPASTKVDGLPGIPQDSGSDKGAASVVIDPVVKLGADHLDAYNYTDVGTAVQLTAPAEGTEGSHALAYALYKVEGLTGKRPTIMDVEATPTALDDNYFIGVADYTSMRWQWFGPYSLPEVEVNLTGQNHRYVSIAGNLYFLVVTYNGMGCTHAQTTLYFGDDGETRLPGAPYCLQASDGAIADAVGLAWNAGPGSGSFEIYRVLAGDANGGIPPPHGEWALIGTSLEPNYLDQAVDPGVVYLYKVRALNDYGASGFSNVDPGYAGDAPPEGFRIHGWVRAPGVEGAVGDPIPNIAVTLLGGQPPLTVQTGPDGGYSFDGLAQGKYIVVPQDPSVFFDPIYRAAIVGPEHPVVECNFTGSTTELPLWRIYGFVYTFDQSDPMLPMNFNPMPDVPVNIALADGSGDPVTVTTNADGYYLVTELPVGLYAVTPGLPGWRFDPATRNVHVTGEHVTAMQNFTGIPDGGGGDLCVIEGNVTNVHGTGLAEIDVYLLPSNDPAHYIAHTVTNVDGGFRFGDLLAGSYLVVPANPHRLFTPRYARLTMLPGEVGTCTFAGAETATSFRLWGFAFCTSGVTLDSYWPLQCTTITGHMDGSEHSFTATTDEDGYWEIPEVPAGTYIVSAAKEFYSFDPESFVQVIDGTVVAPPMFFQGASTVP